MMTRVPNTPDYGAMADAIRRIAADLRRQANGPTASDQIEQAERLEAIADAIRGRSELSGPHSP